MGVLPAEGEDGAVQHDGAGVTKELRTKLTRRLVLQGEGVQEKNCRFSPGEVPSPSKKSATKEPPKLCTSVLGEQNVNQEEKVSTAACEVVEEEPSKLHEIDTAQDTDRVDAVVDAEPTKDGEIAVEGDKVVSTSEVTKEEDEVDGKLAKSSSSRTEYFSLEAADDSEPPSRQLSPQHTPQPSPSGGNSSKRLPGLPEQQAPRLLLRLICCLGVLALIAYLGFNAGVRHTVQQQVVDSTSPRAGGIERSVHASGSPTSAQATGKWAGNAECWSDGYTFEVCCDPSLGPAGNVHCWDPVYNYQRCCLPRSEL